MEMIEAYKIVKGDKLLLVGEGNFTFTKDLILQDSVNIDSDNIEIIATCKEGVPQISSELKQESVHFLVEKGVKVMFNVDATNLKNNPEIANKLFTKIIFNFPHVGGKMKIHLNRKLLKDFFASTSDVLERDGCVVVALCDGQGGTAADKMQRRWDDTWQVTEMAAQSDLVLQKVQSFDVSCFPQYVNIGFRSGDKSFHCENALVHVFVKQTPPRILLGDPFKWAKQQNVSEDLVFDFLEDSLGNPFSEEQSAPSYIFNLLTEKLQGFRIHNDVLHYFSSTETNGESTTNLNPPQELLSKLLQIFIQLKENHNHNHIVTKAVMKRKPIDLKDFSIPPARCQMMVFVQKEVLPLLQKSISDLLTLFDSQYKLKISKQENSLVLNKTLLSKPNTTSNLSVGVIDTVLLPNRLSCHIIHVENLAEILFNTTDWRTVWSGKVELKPSGPPIFSPVSLFPKSYELDISLSVPTSLDQVFFDKFFLILWLLAGDMIVKTEHISSYFPTDRDLNCYCYRITYKSPNAPLFRKRAIKIHEEIVAKFICQNLQVSLR